MSTIYSSNIAPKEKLKNFLYGTAGGGLTSILLGFGNPILAGITLGMTAAVCGIKALKDKYYANSHSAMKAYFAKSAPGAEYELGYKTKTKNNSVKARLPRDTMLPSNAQAYIDQLATAAPQNLGYKMVVEKLANNKYRFKNKIKDAAGIEQPSPEFELDQIIYQTP